MDVYSNKLVKGFLGIKGRNFVNGDGEIIQLRGVGFGNWILPEGYMWKFYSSRADRPRRIEAVIRELCGSEFADDFWRAYAEGYITETDIRLVAEHGFNSIRIPINWRRLMKDEPGITFLEEGFAIIARCLDWCEKYKIYAFFDLHGAPGGQTGANIDDSIDDKPRLFMDKDNWDKALALWRELALRFGDRWIVAGYDLLNEPIHSPKENDNIDHFVGSLKRFYTEAIAEIRKIDTVHLFSLEGHHWSTRLEIFDHLYDEKMCIHFHRYWNAPETDLIEPYLEASKRLNVPLWLGETGENSGEWYTTMFPLLDEHQISWNFWTWKKLDTANSQYSINPPKDYRLVQEYIGGGVHPGYAKAQEIFTEYLHNMRTENCKWNENISNLLLRKPDCFIPALSYDTTPGAGKSFSALTNAVNPTDFRKNDKMRFVPKSNREQKGGKNDNPWEYYALMLTENEFADYTIRLDAEALLSADLSAAAHGSVMEVYLNGTLLETVTLQEGAGFYRQPIVKLPQTANDSVIRLKVKSGVAVLDKIFVLRP